MSLVTWLHALLKSMLSSAFIVVLGTLA